ncbi:MAG: hypothetical protein ABR913_00380 [Sedimentisphaerales bacterium]|jgi:hypothetical protein
MGLEIVTKALEIAWDNITRSRREEDARFREALTKLSEAVTETRIILGKQRKQEIASEDKERLSRLWSKAGIAISEFDRDLAERCDIKGVFWAGPENWTDKQIDDANIRIVAMEREMRELFGGKRQIKKREK